MDKNKADLIIIGEAMYTGKDKNELPAPGGVAVSGNKIIAVGTESEVMSFADKETQVLKYGKDKLLMPAFCDSHLHLVETIYCENGPQLRGVQSEDACIEVCKEWYKNNPDAKWMVSFGWHFSNWPDKTAPNKEKLSKAFPDLPICLIDVDFHAAWVNQKALDVAKITKDTPNPDGAVIHHDENGEPNGYLEENALYLVFDLAKADMEKDEEWCYKNLANTCKIFNQRGITSVMNAFDVSEAWYQTLDKLKANNDLSVRVSITKFLNNEDNFLDGAKKLEKRYANPEDLIRFWGIKGLVDGVGGTYTAWMTEPYNDAPDKQGYPLMAENLLKDKILNALKAGYGVHLHACGSKAVEFSLDTIEEGINKGYVKNQRNTVTHNDVVNDKDFPRFGQLNIIASLQPDMLAPTYSYSDNIYPSRFGEKLMNNAWANRKFFDNAKYVSFSSDSPVTLPKPINAIYRATQRIHDDGTPAGGIHPEQKVTLSESMWASTYGGAYQLDQEKLLGSLEEGKLADIVVLEKNIFEEQPENYRSINAELTILDGNIVYEK